MADLCCRITEGHPALYEEMKRLWAVSFGDSPETVERFFRDRLPRARSLAALDKDAVVGAVYLLSASYREKEIRRNAYYVYALAVLPSHRSLGIGKALMEETFRIIREENAVCFLMPAEESLVQYYEKLGMQPAFHAQTVTVPALRGVDHAASFTMVTPAEYTALRDSCFGQRDGYIRWDAAAVDFALGENECGGGFAVAIRDEESGEVGAAMVRPDGKTLFVPETTLPVEKIPLLAALAGEKGFDEVRVRLPGGENDPVTGMLRGGKIFPHAYLGLTLD